MDKKLRKKYEVYKSKIDFSLRYEDFCKPKEFLNIHETLVGTVLKYFDENLAVFDHIIYEGCMLFFVHLTDDQINNGPIVWKTLEGTACAL